MSDLNNLKTKIYALIEKDQEDNLTALRLLRNFEKGEAQEEIDELLNEMIKLSDYKKELRNIFTFYELKKGE